MKHIIAAASSAMLILSCLTATVHASVESKIFNTIKTEAPPLDVANSNDGFWTFVLTEGGKVYIYTATGQLNDILNVDPATDSISAAGDSGEKLFLGSRSKKTVQLLTLTFAAEIDTTGAPFLGKAEAPVEIVVFSDFQCPFCAKMGQLFTQVLEKNPDTVKIVYKHFPLRTHQYASLAALAAIAANEQGKFWNIHDLLFESHQELNQQKIIEIAQKVQLDMKRFNEDMGKAATKERLTKDINDGQAAGVRGTPTVFINGRQPAQLQYEDVQKMIDAELKILKRDKK